MSWRTAFTNLSNIAVPGVATRYDLDDLPNALPAADLPALAPAFPSSVGLIAEQEESLATLTYDGSVWTASLYVDHVLYWCPAWGDAGLMAVLPALIGAVDAYLAAIRADGTLGGVLARELEIASVLPGVVEYAGVKFYGVSFRHLWRRILP